MNNKWQRSIIWLIVLLTLLPIKAIAHSANLNHIRVSQGETSARVEFFLTQPEHYHVFTLAHPDRLVIDLKNTKLTTNLRHITCHNAVMKSVRSGQPDPSRLRLVIDLKQPVRYTTLAQTNKVILDIYSRKSNSSKTAVVKTSPTELFTIVIDPGHGGKDPGAIGPYGTKEKHIVMGISRHLAKLINKQPGMRAVLTRKGDYFVPLRGRLRLAHKGKADLFVAIHADSYFNNHSHGASVYAISHRGATSEAARWLAQRENYSELGNVDLGELADKSYVLRSVLIDLAQTATVKHSLHLGNSVLQSLYDVTNLHYDRVEQAPFVVLKSPDIPSILVEIGFLSNPKEEEKLREKDYQEHMAEALFSGIQKYIKKYSVVKKV